MIKAILFDMGRVLVPFDFATGYARIEAASGIPAAEIPERIAATGLIERFECGQIEGEQFARELSASLNLRATWDEFREIWNSIFIPGELIPESLVKALAAKYRTVLLSNTNSIHFEWLEPKYPALRHFHARVLSYEAGAMKPSPAIYRKAIEVARCRPEECFFTDDIPAYVEGARREGIDAVQFLSVEQIERELRSRGVSW